MEFNSLQNFTGTYILIESRKMKRGHRTVKLKTDGINEKFRKFVNTGTREKEIETEIEIEREKREGVINREYK